MSEQDNVNLIQQIYSDFKSGNIEKLLAKLDPKIVWELPEMQNIPYAGKRNGRESVSEFFALVNKSQKTLSFEPQSLIAQGDQVVSLGSYKFLIHSTGRTFDAKFAHAFRVKNGAVTEFIEFTDTAQAERAFQKAMNA